MALAEFSPGDIHLDLLLGYLYKDLAQAFEAPGDRRQADRYIELARSAFERVEAGASDAADTAGALNGIGNVYHQRGEPERAIPYYRRAVALVPSYGYAWHDLFAAYDLLARAGHPDLPAMREALRKLKTVAAGYPGIDMGQLEAALRQWEGRR
jgi:tetratricopeptide (TPR) repeat protein